jgi:hypothetical protein
MPAKHSSPNPNIPQMMDMINTWKEPEVSIIYM